MYSGFRLHGRRVLRVGIKKSQVKRGPFPSIFLTGMYNNKFFSSIRIHDSSSYNCISSNIQRLQYAFAFDYNSNSFSIKIF